MTGSAKEGTKLHQLTRHTCTEPFESVNSPEESKKKRDNKRAQNRQGSQGPLMPLFLPDGPTVQLCGDSEMGGK